MHNLVLVIGFGAFLAILLFTFPVLAYGYYMYLVYQHKKENNEPYAKGELRKQFITLILVGVAWYFILQIIVQLTK